MATHQPSILYTVLCMVRVRKSGDIRQGDFLCVGAHANAAWGGIMRFGPFLVIAIVLLILWVGGFLMFHVASGLIHLLLLFAIIFLAIHFFTGSRAAA